MTSQLQSQKDNHDSIKYDLWCAQKAAFDIFICGFCYGISERSMSVIDDGILTGLELGQIVVIALFFVIFITLNPGNRPSFK